MPDLVALNVGGTLFEVERDTLLRYPDTMLGAIASGRWAAPKEKEPRARSPKAKRRKVAISDSDEEGNPGNGAEDDEEAETRKKQGARYLDRGVSGVVH